MIYITGNLRYHKKVSDQGIKCMKEPSTHIRIPVSLKNELDAIAALEQRDRIVVVARMLNESIARMNQIAKDLKERI